jgi:hypothetical protein
MTDRPTIIPAAPGTRLLEIETTARPDGTIDIHPDVARHPVVAWEAWHNTDEDKTEILPVIDDRTRISATRLDTIHEHDDEATYSTFFRLLHPGDDEDQAEDELVDRARRAAQSIADRRARTNAEQRPSIVQQIRDAAHELDTSTRGEGGGDEPRKESGRGSRGAARAREDKFSTPLPEPVRGSDHDR